MANELHIDPRLAPYTALVKDPTDPKSCPMTQLGELGDMAKAPQNGTDIRGRDVSIKFLFPQVLRDEKLIDYQKDNDSPVMQGRASSDEWGAFMMAATHYAKTHPGAVDLELGQNNRGPELPPAVLEKIVAEGSIIYKNLQEARRFESQRNLSPEPAKPDHNRGVKR